MTATQLLHPVPIKQSEYNSDVQGSGLSVLDESQNETLRHPLGVKPSGNALTSNDNLQSSMGTLSRLPDVLIMTLLEFLDIQSLVNLGSTCRAFFAFTSHDQLWRDVAVGSDSLLFNWRGSWRSSVRKLPSAKLPDVDCHSLFSDALYRPFQCSQIDLQPYVFDIPASNQISRLLDLSQQDFDASWANKPFILTAPVRKWRLFKEWSEQDLVQRYSDVMFRAEAVDWPLKTYVKYMNSNKDESPLYLFDRGFVEKMNLAVTADGDYHPPDCFQRDLFSVLGDQRPDHRWLIVGPERSGSTFHKDPNATSAWNAVIRGSKYWIMFPNSCMPPGVYMSEDQSEVTSPLSIAEWLLTFHEEARNTPGCLEGVCGEGEILHVPSGWWHLVVNLEPAIAITQNFVPQSHLNAAVNFLKHKPDQVSGFRSSVKDPSALFLEKLHKTYPDLVVDLETQQTKKRKWEDVVANTDQIEGNRSGFSFGFADDIEE